MESLRSGESLEEDLRVIVSQRRRRILQYLVETSDGHTTIDDLAEYILDITSSEDVPSRDSVRIELHHKDLPKLEDHGLLEYDPRNGAVRYHPSDRIETLLACHFGD